MCTFRGCRTVAGVTLAVVRLALASTGNRATTRVAPIGANLTVGRAAGDSLPVVGEGWGGGSCRGARAVPLGPPPTPDPSPQGGGEELAAPPTPKLAPMRVAPASSLCRLSRCSDVFRSAEASD